MSTAPPEARRTNVVAWLKEAAITIGCAGLVLAIIAIMRSPGGGTAVAVDDMAPAFDVTRAKDGTRLALADLAGKPVVLTFWATWCPACREGLPELEALYRRAGDDIAIVVVSREPARVQLAYVARKGLTVPVYIGDEAFAAYGIETIPTTIVIDARGRIVAEVTGTEDADELEALARGR